MRETVSELGETRSNVVLEYDADCASSLELYIKSVHTSGHWKRPRYGVQTQNAGAREALAAERDALSRAGAFVPRILRRDLCSRANAIRDACWKSHRTRPRECV